MRDWFNKFYTNTICRDKNEHRKSNSNYNSKIIDSNLGGNTYDKDNKNNNNNKDNKSDNKDDDKNE